jgi:hypothetical protein
MESNKVKPKLKVIGAGLYRSGTYSLKTVFEKLGYRKCYHMFEYLDRPQDAEHWNNIIDGKEADFDKLFEDYQAAVDIPTVELIEAVFAKYPDAKVILNTRDAETWFESVQEVIIAKSEDWLKAYPFLEKFKNFFLAERLQNKYNDKEFMLDYYQKHIERIRKLVPKEQLLEFKLSEGWKPICDFLGHEVPNEPFPHLNDRKSIKEKLEKALVETSTNFSK